MESNEGSGVDGTDDDSKAKYNTYCNFAAGYICRGRRLSGRGRALLYVHQDAG
jgi:hypothetical protein